MKNESVIKNVGFTIVWMVLTIGNANAVGMFRVTENYTWLCINLIAAIASVCMLIMNVWWWGFKSRRSTDE